MCAAGGSPGAPALGELLSGNLLGVTTSAVVQKPHQLRRGRTALEVDSFNSALQLVVVEVACAIVEVLQEAHDTGDFRGVALAGVVTRVDALAALCPCAAGNQSEGVQQDGGAERAVSCEETRLDQHAFLVQGALHALLEVTVSEQLPLDAEIGVDSLLLRRQRRPGHPLADVHHVSFGACPSWVISEAEEVVLQGVRVEARVCHVAETEKQRVSFHWLKLFHRLHNM